MRHRPATLCASFFVCAIALLAEVGSATPVTQTLLEGDSLPGDQGWSTVTTAAVLDVSSDGSSISVNTVGVPSIDPDGPFLLFYRDLNVSLGAPYEIEATIRVLQSSYNSFDAGVSLYGTYGGPAGGFQGVGRDRQLFVFLGTNEVGWGDLSEAVAFDTTDSFHTYLLAIDPSGLATLSIDGQLILSRTDFQISRLRMAFGDNTNDPGVDGSFLISSIIVTGEVPEPGVTLLLATGVTLFFALARHRV